MMIKYLAYQKGNETCVYCQALLLGCSALSGEDIVVSQMYTGIFKFEVARLHVLQGLSNIRHRYIGQ